MYVGHSHRNLI